MSAFGLTSTPDEMTASRPVLTEKAKNIVISTLQSLSSSKGKVDTDVLVSPIKSPTHSLSDWTLIPPVTDVEITTHNVNNGTESRIWAHGFHPAGPIFRPQHSSSIITTNISEIDNAINHFSYSVESVLKQAPHLSKDMGALGMLEYSRFRQTSDPDELEKAIEHLGTAVVLLRHQSSQDTQLPPLLYCLGCAFQYRFYRTRDINDLDQAIPHYQDAITFTAGEGSENLIAFHSDLGSAFQARFERRGGISDVEGAVHHHRRALEVASKLKEDLIPILTSNLGIAYQSRFERLWETIDLESAILNLSRSVEISSSDDPSLPSRLNNLGLSLQSRFEFDDNSKSLEEAIQAFRKSVDLTDSHHPEWLANLGTAYRIKAEKAEDIKALNEAIIFLKAAVDLSEESTSIHHDFLPKFLGKLAICLTVKARLDPHEAEVIDDAISHFERALQLTSEGHDVERSSILLHHDNALHIRFKKTQDVEDAITAIAAFQKCSELRYGPIMARLQAAIRWAQIAHEAREFMTALTAYTAAIQLLPQAAWIGQSVNSRRRILASQPATLAADAAACAIEKRAYSKAVELLEQGRTIFWSQALQLRPDLTDLLAINQTLAEELEAVAKELEPRTFQDSFHAQVHTTRSDLEDSSRHHRALAQKWQRIVDKVRKLPGFGNFLKPHPFSYLQNAAACGPIIIANASSYRCDALIVLKEGPPIHVPLPSASFATLTKQARAVDPRWTHKRDFDIALGILWRTTLSPISRKLSTLFTDKNERIRVWWCPTGPLTFFPLHMAGSSTGALKKDNFVPSYTSNLGSLIRARESLPHVPQPIRLLLVGVSAPFSGLSKLPKVKDEIDIIHKSAVSRGISIKVLEDKDATKDAVNNSLPEASWVHFACHGDSDDSEPFSASLHLQDSGLSLADIAQHRLPIADFAFFTACDTAAARSGPVGKALTEEALHLATGFQFAGFRSLIATMWTVLDDISVHVSHEVYTQLWKNDSSDSSEAAEALDFAVRKLVGASLGNGLKGDARGPVNIPVGGLRELSKAEKEKIEADGRLIPFVHFGI